MKLPSDVVVRRTMRILCDQFEQVNRILTGISTTVNITHPSGQCDGAPAWSVKSTITLNGDKMPRMCEPADYVVVSGLNYHELCHVVWTPGVDFVRRTVGDSIADSLKNDRDVQRAWNILEDQRIETLMVAKYRNLRHYFTAIFVKYILSGDVDTMYLLTHGRKYLPRKVRRYLEQSFTCGERDFVLGEIKRIIDEYRLLDLSTAGGLHRAYLLIRQFISILNRAGLTMPKPPCTDNNGAAVTSKGTSDPQSADGLSKKARSEDQSEDEQKEDNESNSGAKNQDDETEDKDGSSSGDADANDDTPGSGNHKKQRATLGKLLDEALAEAVSDDKVQQEVKSLSDAVSNALPTTVETMRTMHSHLKIASVHHQNAADIATALRETEMDVDPGWHPHASSGRLNVGRAMLADPTDDDLWDRWEEGGPDGLDIEMVILLDRSGSMHKHELELTNAAWVMKRAADSAGVALSVFTYNALAACVYLAHERAEDDLLTHIHPNGGTNPYTALCDAHAILTGTARKVKILMLMTDGMFSDSTCNSEYQKLGLGSSDDVIQDLNDIGARTMMVFLSPDGIESWNDAVRDAYLQNIIWHECQGRHVITSMEEMPDIMRDTLREVMQDRRR